MLSLPVPLSAAQSKPMPAVTRPLPAVPGRSGPVRRAPTTSRRSRDNRRQAYEFGLSAEASVGQYLRAGGYHTLARRARIGDAEVDLIVLREDVVAFVEVKARRDGADGLEAVTPRKQRQIVMAANGWISDNAAFAGCTIRFDVALVSRHGDLEYLESAFEAGDANGWA